MPPLGHSAILLTCIDRKLVVKNNFRSFESGCFTQGLLYTGSGNRIWHSQVMRVKEVMSITCFFAVCCFVFKIKFLKDSFRNTIRVSNIVDKEQTRHFLGRIWVQTVSKAYQQTTPVSKKLTLSHIAIRALYWN